MPKKTGCVEYIPPIPKKIKIDAPTHNILHLFTYTERYVVPDYSFISRWNDLTMRWPVVTAIDDTTTDC